MIKLIMHGCNGKMGQVISRLLENDEEACLVAGIDARDDGHNPYPVFTDIKECNVEADALIARRRPLWTRCFPTAWKRSFPVCSVPPDFPKNSLKR